VTAPDEVVPVLRVVDADASARWYQRLGFSVSFVHRFEPDFPAFVGIERGRVHLYLSEHSGDAQPGALVHLWVGNVDVVAAEFGVPVEEEPEGRMIELTDPDGNRFRIGSRRARSRAGEQAVLVTGVYGAGKSTVVEDLVILLEEAGVPYAALDLDWLCWYDTYVDGDDGWDMLLANLTAVVGNYRSAGVTRFGMAGFFESATEVERLRSVLAMPVATVQLEVPLTVVEQRLAAVGTAERLANLDEARRQIAEGRGRDFADLVIAGDRPIREVSLEVLNWLGWID
jgi:hypothetical protein